jgi:hypothetical protein
MAAISKDQNLRSSLVRSIKPKLLPWFGSAIGRDDNTILISHFDIHKYWPLMSLKASDSS